MQKYRNWRKSGIVEYEIGSDFIELKFKGNPKIYPYTYELDGVTSIEEMKKRAKKGIGLCSYIRKNVKRKFK